jgi:tRNA pseudouridine32 synthase/23S rRNA pseudouridine746 synthase
VILFEPQPAGIPARLPSPFDPEPHPLARRAAAELELPPDVNERGKMLGVLVVADRDGRIGWLKGFSGMLGGRWLVEGWVPPLFDPAERDTFWPAGEAELDRLEAEHRALTSDQRRAELLALDAAHAAGRRDLRDRHRANRDRRREMRASGRDLEALAAESRHDTAALRRLETAQAAERADLARAVLELDARRATLEAVRLARSQAMWKQMVAGYTLENARGERTSLPALFDPEPPPGGAGDCAGPKLLGYAYRHRLRPLAFAEVWWGAPPAAGGRVAGQFYAACRGKCGVVLPWMLRGLDVDDAPLPGADPVADDQPTVLHEDDQLFVVDKPEGLLSVPGRHDKLKDSVLLRLRQRHPAAAVVHRLDLDTSGLLLASKDEATYVALQRQFAERRVDKRYVAWLDGDVAVDAGTIELPIRVDHLDRPRQIVDEEHGKRALTEWRVLLREGGRTRVELWPHTGRTHQLRVHCAHPRGLGAPIVGDRIYGRPGPRLMLHATTLAFDHPRTGARLSFSSPPPF